MKQYLVIILLTILSISAYTSNIKKTIKTESEKKIKINRIVGVFPILLFNTDKDEESIDECINRKLASLKTELGGNKGINDIKKTLNNAKQICDYEATKSMMNLLSANKTTKTINLEDIFNDTDNKDCGRCKDYTQISSKLKDMIDKYEEIER